jgi:hypothetical protein
MNTLFLEKSFYLFSFFDIRFNLFAFIYVAPKYCLRLCSLENLSVFQSEQTITLKIGIYISKILFFPFKYRNTPYLVPATNLKFFFIFKVGSGY